MGEGDSMKNRIISVVLSFFVIVNIILIACAFNVTPLTIKRDTFVYEYGSEISTKPRDYINANEAILSQVILNFSNLKNEIGEDQAGNQSASLRVKIVAGQNGNNPTLTGIDDIEVLKNSKFNPLDGVKATDGSGNDITKNIKILKNNVNTDKVGDYEVIYSITNDKGHNLQRTRRVSVIKTEKAGE